jgi:UDP-glucose 4-epimerase
MHVLVTGGSGQVGRFIVLRLVLDGHQVTALGRRPVHLPGAGFLPWRLEAADCGLPDADALVHCALDHVAGTYRCGEGQDPDGFRRRNLDGSLALFGAAKRAGVGRCVFLSSRAVYGGRSGVLRESDAARPDTLYGEVKLAAERELAAIGDGVEGIAIRATGVYGLPPGLDRHKWSGLFEAYLRGEPIAPRCGTEVHGEDLAAAVVLLLTEPGEAVRPGVFNLSDVLVDRHDLLALVKARCGCRHPLPERADAGERGVMASDRLRGLGWRPGGWQRLRDFVAECRDVPGGSR